MSDEGGGGPGVTSGNQVARGICADLPVQPRNRNSVIAVTVAPAGGNTAWAPANTWVKSSEPAGRKIRSTATTNPKSPVRVTMNAFLPSAALISSLEQDPVRR